MPSKLEVEFPQPVLFQRHRSPVAVDAKGYIIFVDFDKTGGIYEVLFGIVDDHESSEELFIHFELGISRCDGLKVHLSPPQFLITVHH